MKNIGRFDADGCQIVVVNPEIFSRDVAFDNRKIFKRRVCFTGNSFDGGHCFFDKLRLNEQKKLCVRIRQPFDEAFGNKAGKTR